MKELIPPCIQYKNRFVITKHGKPLAEADPYEEGEERRSLRESLALVGDIISPVADDCT